MMSQILLTGEFKWVESPDELKGQISKLAKKWSKDYLFEVDMSYHGNLHDLHNDLLFMWEKMKISGVQKLVPNLFHKKKYVIHVSMLRLLTKPSNMGLFCNKFV